MIREAYRDGIFPMGDPEHDRITWHQPKRRAVLPLDGFHVSRSLARTLSLGRFQVSFNQAFAQVIDACADRPRAGGTWITPRLRDAYVALHKLGQASSVEVWKDNALAGGLYGVHLGGAFFAESKFHRVSDMSKVALAQLVFHLRDRGFRLLEVQYLTPHLEQFGAIEITHRAYLQRLQEALRAPCEFAAKPL